MNETSSVSLSISTMTTEDQLEAIRSRIVEQKLMREQNYFYWTIISTNMEDLYAITDALESEGYTVKPLTGVVTAGGEAATKIRVKIEWNEKLSLLCCRLCGCKN